MQAAVIVQTLLTGPNGATLGQTESPASIAPGEPSEVSQEISVANPALWSPQSPLLYQAVTRVMIAGKVVDEVLTPFGIRSIAWSMEKGLQLNGKPIKLAGGSVHHDNGALGAAAFDRAEERKVELLKAAGFNAVRTAHNPPSTAFLDACDRLGLLVLDEPFDVWTSSKVKFDYARFFGEWWQRDIDAMVLRDRNHPSIIIWGIGNEIPQAWTKDGGPIARKLAARVRELDGTRPLTEAFPGATYTANTDAVFAAVDIGGYNYNLAANGPKDHQRVPNRIMMSTESLAGDAFQEWQMAKDNPYILGEFVWTAMDYLGESGIGATSFVSPEDAAKAAQAKQMMKFAMTQMGANGEDPFAAMAKPDKTQAPDTSKMMSLVSPGYPWHGSNCGDVDLTGLRKPQSFYRDILWNGGDRVFATVHVPPPEGKQLVAIAWGVPPTLPSWTWPGQEGKPMQVDVYSGTDKVRLYLNDKLIGEMPTGRDQQFKATFSVPYMPGTLKAVGVRGDQNVAESVLTTAGEATQLRLTADRAIVHANGEDLSFIKVEALDANGRLQPNATQLIGFELNGPATIAAVGNGDGTSDELYQGNQRKLYNGRAQVIVRTSKTPGDIQLKATATGLRAAQQTLQSKGPVSQSAKL